MTTPVEVVARRRMERERLLDLARAYARELDPALEVRAAVVVGSVARGSFHVASDVDVVVVADRLPADPADRWQRVVSQRGVIEPIAWTPEEWRREHRRRNPLAVDVLDHGVWLVGSPAVLT